MSVPRKAVILAGGFGTRLAEETGVKPKPLVEVGGAPILWHIMKIFSAHGVEEFIICAGYKGHLIKEYFDRFHLQRGDITFDLGRQEIVRHSSPSEKWRVTVADTGWSTMTGGRLRRVRKHIGNEPFFFTYGDGVGNVDLTALSQFHRSHGALATVTAVQPPGRFGVFSLSSEHDRITHFHEKPVGDGRDASSGWINGGFFLLEPAVIDLIENDETVWEREPLEHLARENQLMAFRHTGFWQPMDTLRDKTVLNELWATHKAPWKVW